MILVDIDCREDNMYVDSRITSWLIRLRMGTWRWNYNNISGRLIAVEFDNPEDAVAFKLALSL